jgi:type II secretion system (T2SS) protein F
MTALQLWMLAGVLGMAGVACLVWYLAPAEPDLADVVGRLSPTAAVRGDGRADDALTLTDRVGLWMVGRAPSGWLKVPVQDLALLGRPIYAFYAEKLLVVVVSAIAIPVTTSALLLVGVPVYVPVVLTAVAACLAWFWPNQTLRENAAQARAEFTAALGAYVDLVALERKAGGSGIRQALENAAQVGDSWPFRRISDALTRSRFAGVGAWDALSELATELNLPELDEFADLMRLAGEESTQIYDSLRARSAELRAAKMTADLAKANAADERMAFPIVAMTVIFTAIIMAPALFRLLTG